MQSDHERRASVVPGVLLAGSIVVLSDALRRVPGIAMFTPLLLAVVLGMLVGNLVRVPRAFDAGLAFCVRQPLRWGVALLGLQVSLGEMLTVGGTGLAIVCTSVLLCISTCLLCGRLLRVERNLVLLIAAGTSICGASAIVAANAVTRGREADVAYAVGVITILGTAAMFGYPAIGHWLALPAQAYGLWIGSSVQEVSQVVAAAFAHGTTAGALGTITKLVRVLFLAPLALLLPLLTPAASKAAARGVVLPWFVVGFVLCVATGSLGVLPPVVKTAAALTAQSLLATAMAAVGIGTQLRSIRPRGWRPLVLGAIGAVTIASCSLALIMLWMRENAR